MNGDTEKAIEEILNDFERQPLQEKRTFRSYLNQPELINVSSANAVFQSPPISGLTNSEYYNFTVNLPRPALNVKSLQLLKAIIPQAQCSIPDYSLVFPYYRLRTLPIDLSGRVAFIDLPTAENLFFVRLLPSNYKPENMAKSRPENFRDYGYNRTFNDYQELVKEVNKACVNDPFLHTTAQQLPGGAGYQYLSDEITFSFDETLNKIIFTGLKMNLPPEINAYTEWDPTITYAESDVVFAKDQEQSPNSRIQFFQSRINDNSGNFPFYYTDEWQNVTNLINGYPTWSFNFSYAINDVVQYNDIIYRCVQAVGILDENPPPTSPGYWEDASQFFNANPLFNSYLIAGYGDKSVKELIYNIEFQTTDQPNQGGNFDYERDQAFVVASIPGNQYVEGQTLARRMGFTWDGFGIIRDDRLNNILTDTITFASTVILFYNRIRPIPKYFVVNDPVVLGISPNTGFLDSYTADGYANLVYSSIISIYTTIVGTSSVDTQRDANLLAMIEMNCANLGVAMIGNYIDTALTKIQSEIYSMYIELRDENGEPYYLTNNATTNFLLKLTYN
jgi:hypothetical protein